MTARENNKDWRQSQVQTDEGGLKAVGTWLKAARELNGESLNDVSRVTRIGKNYLEAIEEGLISKLPSPAYTRGFIRLYAAHLGLSPDEALKILDRNQTSETSPAGGDSDTKTEPGITKGHASPRRNRLLILLILLLGIAAALLLFSRPDRMVSPEKPAQSALKAPPPNEGMTKDPAGTPAVNSVPEPPAAGAGKSAGNGIILRLKAVRDGKLHITIDGAVSQEYDLVTGDIVEWKAEKGFLLDIEDAASVEGELNGVPLKPFGKQGHPAHMLIGSDGADER